MVYDYEKVQRWVAAVPRVANAPFKLWIYCLEGGVPYNSPVGKLCDEFRASSLWEQVNMLYGLRDVINAVALDDAKSYTRRARQQDDKGG